MSYFTDKFDNQIIELLNLGKIGVLPTDTIYGLSARASDQKAVEKIHELKQRDQGKPLVVLIADKNQLQDLSIESAQANIVDKYWPGSVSMEFDANKSPKWLHRGIKTFAIRMPDYKELRDLIKKVGPIVSTSVNLQGGEPLNSIDQTRSQFGDQLDFYIDVGDLSNNQPSTLVVPVDGKLKVVRQGALKINKEDLAT